MSDDFEEISCYWVYENFEQGKWRECSSYFNVKECSEEDMKKSLYPGLRLTQQKLLRKVF